MAEQRTLERKLVFKQEWPHWEDVEFRLRDIYERNKKKWYEWKKGVDKRHDIINEALENNLNKEFESRLGKCVVLSNPLFGQHEFYIAVGKELLSYESIDDSVTSYHEIEIKMRKLGRDVAYLCSEFNDDGLMREEVCWLGRLTHEANTELSFRLAYSLENEEGRKWPFSDCSEHELLSLYAIYQQGKLEFLTKKMGYGNSLSFLDKNKEENV